MHTDGTQQPQLSRQTTLYEINERSTADESKPYRLNEKVYGLNSKVTE